jgi:hypothetical protein
MEMQVLVTNILVISDQSEEPVPMKYKRSGDVTK